MLKTTCALMRQFDSLSPAGQAQMLADVRHILAQSRGHKADLRNATFRAGRDAAPRQAGPAQPHSLT